MNKQILIFALLGSAASMLVVACSNNNGNGDGGTDSSVPDTGTPETGGNDAGTDSGIPAPPTLKTQIDRFGRPAVNTALNHVFDPTDNVDGGAGGVAKDSYNADTNVSGWPASYAPQFAGNLAIYDGLDQVCGNQLGFAVANTYGTLAGLIADDRLYLDTSKAGPCTQYLGVELNATGLVHNSDCGGRTLPMDVIDITYSALATGMTSGVTDGVSAVASKTNGTTFPYLAAPL